MAPRITLWHMAGSPPSWAVRMLADILGVEVELKDIDFFAMEHKSPEFTKLNPMGTVPLIKDGDFYIAESHTIMKYLLDKYGQQHRETLYPSELRARALVDQAMFFDTGVVFIRVKIVALPAIFEGVDGLTPKVIEQLEDAYSIVETYLNRTTYAAGDHITIADLSLGSTVLALNGLYAVDSGRYPRTTAWLKKLQSLPYFQKIAVPGAVILGDAIRSCWEKNKK